MQRQYLDDPLPLHQLIFLNKNIDICPWFFANNCHDPLDLMFLMSPCKDREDLDKAPEPPNGRYLFFDHDLWDDSTGGGGSVGAIVEEEFFNNKEWRKAEPAGETQVPPDTSGGYLDNRDVSI